MQLEYTQEQILTDHEWVRRIELGGKLFHGGYTEDGTYHTPRTLYRWPAIKAWQNRLTEEGHGYRLVSRDIVPDFFPNVAQSKLLLRYEITEPMATILTLIGITEGFGNSGIQSLPKMRFQDYVKEDLTGTCLDHFDKGLLLAHGMDEAGNPEKGEYGHDHMWYTIRDLALNKPKIPKDIMKMLFLPAPPEAGNGSEESSSNLRMRITPEGVLSGKVDMMIGFMSMVLIIEIMADAGFKWAREIMSDPEAVPGHSEDCRLLIDCIAADEQPHVNYLETGLAELRCRTLITKDGTELPGEEVVDGALEKLTRAQLGSRYWQLLEKREQMIRESILDHSQGKRILDEFYSLGPQVSEMRMQSAS